MVWRESIHTFFWLPFLNAVQDHNTGLVVQVLSAHRRFATLSLSRIYSSIPLTAVITMVPSTNDSLEETYSYINGLISDGHLQATLTSPSDLSKSILRFDTSIDKSSEKSRSESQKYAELLKQKEKVEELSWHVQDAQRKLEFSKEFLEATRKAKKNEGKRPGSPVPLGVDDFADEEMLADF